jgi:dihydropteroate synthase
MGILNVTPDSFSDGGDYMDPKSALQKGVRMMEEGASIIDVGGESTRPGSSPVPAEEELKRVLPVIQGLVEAKIPVSIDTSKPTVAMEALKAGACFLNDVQGMRNPQMLEIAIAYSANVCIMHMQNTPSTMQQSPTYTNVVIEVRDFLYSQANKAERAGIPKEKIWIDCGIGFGKTLEHNLELLKNLTLFTKKYQVLVGVSRKSFLAALTEQVEPKKRLPGSIAAALFAGLQGVKMLRVHDVKETVEALTVWSALKPPQGVAES